MAGFTVRENGDFTEIETAVRRDPLVTGIAILLALVALIVVGLMAIIAVRTGGFGAHVLRVLIASGVLLGGAIGILCWTTRLEVLRVGAAHISKGSRVLGWRVNPTHIELDGAATVRLSEPAERPQGSVVIVCGAQSLFFAADLDEVAAQRMIARLEPLLSTDVNAPAASSSAARANPR